MAYRLSDRKARQLAELLADYLRDGEEIDPSAPRASELTVLELLEDLAGSTAGLEQRRIEEVIDGANGEGWTP